MTGLWGERADPHFQFTLLDSTDADIRDISAQVIGGSLSLTAGRLGGTGSLELDGSGINFGSQRVRISYDPGVEGVAPWDIGVYLFTSPTRTRDGLRERIEVGLTTKLQILEEASTVGTANLSTATLIIDTVAGLIRGTGETRVMVSGDVKRFLEPYTADAEKSLLSICNDLLDAAGFWGVSVDGRGQFVLVPYQPPRARPVVWTFTENAASIILADQVDERDTLSVPNRFVVYTSGTDDAPPLVGVAQDTNPDSPFSIPSRGGRVIEARDSVEAATQADADAIAARRLLALQSPVGKRSVTHAMIPVRPREVVEHVRADGSRARFTIQKLDFSFDFDTQMKAEWNEVTT